MGYGYLIHIHDKSSRFFLLIYTVFSINLECSIKPPFVALPT